MSSYALRLPESLKLAAKRIAAADDTTMNQFFVVAIAEKISAMETAKFFEQRAALGKASRDLHIIRHHQVNLHVVIGHCFPKHLDHQLDTFGARR